MPDQPPTLPIPSPRQVNWHALAFYGFLHFTVNTFTGREWGLGNEDPRIFNPRHFDAQQIAGVARQAGMAGLILTAKHHDGFCLWPSDHTIHSVKSSAWKGGKGDVVAGIAAACAAEGLKFGIYLSPWDRNHVTYGTPDYLIYYRAQLRELLTRYGDLFEIWFDGANGGDGYYGGKYEKRTIDGRTYYEWEKTYALVRELQPDACIFNPPGADIRWVGNEEGIAGDPCWHTFSPGDDDMVPETLNRGIADGPLWFPAECDVSIRPGWFYHAEEDHQVRTPENLLDLWFKSVGRGANLLLNLPPTPEGQIHTHDIRALEGFRTLREACLRTCQSDGAREAQRTDEEGHPFYEWILPEEKIINLIDLQEDIRGGQRVRGYRIDGDAGFGWQKLASGEMIGNRRLLRLESRRFSRIRLTITASIAPPQLSTLRLFDASAAFG